MKLHPDTKPAEYDALWTKIDKDGDGNLDQMELAAFFGFNFDLLAKDMSDIAAAEAAMAEMDDDQILEALQVRVRMPLHSPPLATLTRLSNQSKWDGGGRGTRGGADADADAGGVARVRVADGAGAARAQAAAGAGLQAGSGGQAACAPQLAR